MNSLNLGLRASLSCFYLVLRGLPIVMPVEVLKTKSCNRRPKNSPNRFVRLRITSLIILKGFSESPEEPTATEAQDGCECTDKGNLLHYFDFAKSNML